MKNPVWYVQHVGLYDKREWRWSLDCPYTYVACMSFKDTPCEVTNKYSHSNITWVNWQQEKLKIPDTCSRQ